MYNLLSIRSKVTKHHEDFWSRYSEIYARNPYDEISNSEGFVDLGTTVNRVCHFAVIEKLKQLHRESGWELHEIDSSACQLREAMAKMMTVLLDSHEKVLPTNLICLNGIRNCRDLLAHCLAQDGEAFLVPTPMCGRTYTDLVQRTGVEVFPIETITSEKENPILTIEKIVNAYRRATTMKKVVRGIYLTNPNIMGDVYSHELLLEILKFCKGYYLHFVIDETEAFSVHGEFQFNSVLKFRQVPDPDRTHIVYGLNKDFGLGDLGVGVIHTKCEELKKNLTSLLCLGSITSSPSMVLAAELLEDMVWCKEYVHTNRERLTCLYSYSVEYLKTNNFRVRESPAGYHVWLDLSSYCGKTFEGERKLFDYLLNEYKLYIVPGEHCLSPIPGWFRIVIAQKLTVLEAGIKRFIKAIQNYKP